MKVKQARLNNRVERDVLLNTAEIWIIRFYNSKQFALTTFFESNAFDAFSRDKKGIKNKIEMFVINEKSAMLVNL